MAGEKALPEGMAPEGMIPEGAPAGLVPPKGTKEPGGRFTKGQLLHSRKFRDRRDILEALLKDGELYTVKAVEEKIKRYMKGKVR